MLTWLATSAAILAATSTTTSSVATEVAAPEAAPAALEAAPVPPAQPESAPLPEPSVTPPGSSPAGGAAAPAASAEAKAPAKPFSKRFAGSQFWFQTSATFGTFSKGFLQDYDPTVVSFASLSPRFAINDDFQLRGRIGLTYEWTDSNITSTRYIANLTDTTLQLFYRSIPSFYGVKMQVAPQVVLPTSNASNSRTMRVSPGLLTQFFRGWSMPGDGSLLAIGLASYQRPIYSHTTAGIDVGSVGYDRQVVALNGTADPTSQAQLSGIANARDIISWTLVLVGSWGDWAPGVAFNMSHQSHYDFAELDVVSDATDNPGWRVFTAFSVWLDYTPLPWLTAEIGYSMRQQLIGGDGQYRNPFYNRFGDPQLYLGVNLGLETLYGVISGQDTGEGGVVRN